MDSALGRKLEMNTAEFLSVQVHYVDPDFSLYKQGAIVPFCMIFRSNILAVKVQSSFRADVLPIISRIFV